MVLCWSARAAASDWVGAEIKHSLISNRPISPWLLDDTPLPPLLAKIQGIRGADPAPVVKEIAEKRTLYRRRVAAILLTGGVILAPVLWWSPRIFTRQNIPFRGHVIDEQGNAVSGATIAADGVRVATDTSGDFAVVLPGPPSRRALRVTAWKPGYRSRTIDTQSDVPDLGVVLEKDR